MMNSSQTAAGITGYPALEKYRQHMDRYEISFALEASIEFISGTNVYAEQHKAMGNRQGRNQGRAAPQRAQPHGGGRCALASVLLEAHHPRALASASSPSSRQSTSVK